MLLIGLVLAGAAGAADNVLLIQMRAGGGYTVWHTEGESRLSDEEVMELEAAALTGGAVEVPTGAGPARAEETPDGIVIRLPQAPRDKALLVDRDGCGHVRLWHAAGSTNFDDDQLTEIVMSALPEGGTRITVGAFHAKAYLTRLGVTAALWRIPRSR